MGIENLDSSNNEIEALNSYSNESNVNEVVEQKECIDCGDFFNITQGEVNYFVQHELVSPKRCKPCRAIRRATNTLPTPDTYRTPILPAKRVSITCDHCGRDAEVPFKPFPDSSVYCKVCWVGIKNIGAPINYS